MGWGAKSRGGGAPRTRVDSRKPLWLPQTPLLPKKSDVRLCPLCPPVSGQRTGSCWQGILGVVVLRLLPVTEMSAKGMGWCWVSWDKSNAEVSDKATPEKLPTTWSIFYFGCTTRLWHLSSQTRDWTWALSRESTESLLLDHQGISNMVPFLLGTKLNNVLFDHSGNGVPELAWETGLWDPTVKFSGI